MLHQDTASPHFPVVHLVYSPHFHSLVRFVCCPPCSFLRAFAVQFGKPLVSQQTTTKLDSKKKAVKSTSCVSSAVMILSLLLVIRCCACSREPPITTFRHVPCAVPDEGLVRLLLLNVLSTGNCWPIGASSSEPAAA